MDCLRITLLGPPNISWGGQSLSIPRRQVRALLYRLATNLQSVTRDELCYLFWSDNPPSTARRNLTHLLTHLRLAIPEPNLVDISKENVTLDPLRVWSDTYEFNHLLAECRESLPVEHNTVADLTLPFEALVKAVNSYHSPFLSDFSLRECHEFEAWVNRERRDYECRYLEALLDLVGIFQDYKDYDTAITYANRYLEVDNLAEGVHCRLIELYAAKGDHSAVERQFEQCAAILEQELDISPSPRTWAIYQSVLGSRPQAVLLPSQALADSSRAKLKIPFIGHQEILKQIERVVNLARLGRSKIVLISGEQGSGKSRLLQQIASQYHCHATVLFGACNPGIRNLPYHPVAEVFRSAFETHAPLIKVSPLWLAEAARLLPEMYTRYPNLPEPLPAKPEEARRRLFEALYQLASNLANRSSPLLLCLDDLHWADATTLEWLVYLGNRLAFEGLNHLVIFITCRSEEAYCLDELRLALKRLAVLEELHLNGLETDQALEYLRHLFGSSETSQALAARLHQFSGANPFFLFETLQALVENQSIPLKMADLEDMPVPKTVQEAVYQRLASLNPNQRRILEFAAVWNRSFSIDIVKWATKWNELEILESLEDLAKRRILTERDGRYLLHHELVRMVIYNDLSYDRRRILHRQCGKILEHLHPDETTLLARHFEQSGEPGKAAGYFLRAGEEASTTYAFQDALDFSSRALDLLKQEATALAKPEELSINYRKQILALSRRGSAFRALGDMQSYQNDFEEEARIAKVLGDENIQAQIHLREAKAHRWFCRYPQARECAEKALQMGREAGNELLQARAMREIGLAVCDTGNFSTTLSILEEALQRFKDLEEAGFEIHTLCNLSTLFAYLGDFNRSEQLAVSALGRCEQAQLPYLRRIALGSLGATLAGLGQEKQARECLLASLEIARQIADRAQEIFCLYHLGRLENQAGRPEEALRSLRDGLALAERIDARAEQSRLYSGIAEAHRLLRNARLAKVFAYKAIELAKRHARLYDQDLAQRVLYDLEDSL